MRIKTFKGNWSTVFIRAMKARAYHGYHRYGSAKLHAQLTDMFENAEIRLAKYKETGNTEMLVDAANFLMFEFMYPKHKQAHFRPLNSDESPGITGVSAREFERRFYKHDGD